MKRAVPILASLAMVAALAGCGRDEAAPAGLEEPAATVRLPAAPGRPGAGYFNLPVRGDRGALVSVTSPQAGRVELHETMSGGGMSGMRAIERIPVRAGETLIFEPGGRHLMLFDLDPSLRPGGRVELVLAFERGGPERVSAEAVAPGTGIDH